MTLKLACTLMAAWLVTPALLAANGPPPTLKLNSLFILADARRFRTRPRDSVAVRQT